MKTHRSERGAVDLLLIVLMVAVVGVGGYAYWHYQQAAKGEVVTNDNVPKKTDPYKGWVTYQSATEKSSFKYPSDWKKSTGAESIIPQSDSIDLVGPTGINITWQSAVDGLGGACNSLVPLQSNGACPEITYTSVTPIAGAPGLAIVEGYVTGDGKHYQPTLNVLSAGTKVGTTRDMGYAYFTGKNNGAFARNHGYSINDNVSAYLGASLTGKLTKSQAIAAFSTPEVKTAILILASYSY